MCGKRTPIKFEFEADLLEKIDALKKYYEVQNNAELIRVLVNEKAQQLDSAPMEVTANGS